MHSKNHDARSPHTLLPSLIPRLHFSCGSAKWVWSTAYSIFVQVRQHSGALFFSNLTLDIIEDCIPISTLHAISTSEMDIDQATIAAMYRLGYLLEGAQVGGLGIHNPVDMTSQWLQNIGTKTV